MERLTKRTQQIAGHNLAYVSAEDCFDTWGVPKTFMGNAIDRLAAIEDVLGNEYDLDRLRELAQADREGISPCTFCRFNPPSSGDGKPCCMCPAVAALRRKQDG
jgi:hypothetical protein